MVFETKRGKKPPQQQNTISLLKYPSENTQSLEGIWNSDS